MKKRRSQDRYEEARALAKDAQHEHERAVRGFKAAAAAVGPVYAAGRAFEMVLAERRCWRRFLQRRFGARIVNTDGNDRIVEVKNWPGRKLLEQMDSGLEAPGREERKRLGQEYVKEEWLFLLALHMHAAWELSWRVMLERGVRALDEPGAALWTEDEERLRVYVAVLEGFILAQKKKHELVSLTAPPDTLSPTVRAAVAAMLTGQTEAMISLSENKRLSAVLGEQGDAREKLLEELPGAVMEEWGTSEAILSGEKYREFVQRVARALERTGNESNSLARRGKLSPLGDVTEAADEISEFEREEEARQRLDALEQKAKLSTQQAEIWRRLRRGMEIAEIAAELGISRNQVSSQKKRIKRKVGDAAAGF
jgi:DNA-binding CsgD family transcriptional regulator